MKDPADFSFAKISDALQRHGLALTKLVAKLSVLPTTRHLGERLAKVCAEIDAIDAALADGDHMGTK